MKKEIKFNELSLPDKALLIAEFGGYIMSIEFGDYWLHLYSLNSNFIQIFYNISTRQIDKIVMAEYNDLDKYTDRIVIDRM